MGYTCPVKVDLTITIYLSQRNIKMTDCMMMAQVALSRERYHYLNKRADDGPQW